MTLRKFTDGGVLCGGLNQQNIGFSVGRCSFSLLQPPVKVFCRQGHNRCQTLTMLIILAAMTKIPNSKGQPDFDIGRLKKDAGGVTGKKADKPMTRV